MTKYVIEILREINEDPSKAGLHRNNAALRTIMEYAFDTRKKFILPEGNPPFKPDAAPLGMSPGNFNMETQKFYIYCRPDLKPIRRESLFVQLLEGLHPSEAEVVLAIKDQDIGRLFPNITLEVVQLFTVIPMEFAAVPKPKSEEKSRGKGRPPGSKNKGTEQMEDSE